MDSKIANMLAGLAALVAVGVSQPAVAQDKNDPLGDDLDNYWSVDRDLPVVQERLYERKNTFGIGIHAGLLSSEPFYWYIPVGGRLTFFFSDHAGVELAGQYMGSPSSTGPLTNDTEITSFFKTRLEDAFDESTDLEDRFLWRANAVLLWAPLYGKWSFLNNKLSHFDFNLALGGGAVSVLRPNFDRTEATSVVTPELTFGGGIHFFLGKHWTLRADGRFYVYQGADTPSARTGFDAQDQTTFETENSNFFKRLEVPSEFLLGVTYLF